MDTQAERRWLMERLRAGADCLKFARGMSLKPRAAAQVETVQITARESEIIGANLTEAADKIASLLARVDEMERAMVEINRRASPRPDRTLGDCADELMWVCSIARSLLPDAGEGG